MDARSSAFSIVSERLQRLAEGAVARAVDVDPLLRLLSHADLRTLGDTFIGIDDEGGALTLQTRWPEDSYASQKFFDFHAVGFTVQSDRVQPLLELYPGDPLMDVRAGAASEPLGCTLHVLGSRPIAEDMAAIVEVSRTDRPRHDAMLAICAPLAALTAGCCDGIADQAMSDGRDRWFVRFILPNESPKSMAATMQAIGDVASQLAISETQMAMFMKIHPALAVKRPLIASVSITDGQRDQCIGLEYAPVSWDAARSLMRSFYGQSSARLVSALARETGARVAAMIRLEMRSVEPPRMQVWAELLPEVG